MGGDALTSCFGHQGGSFFKVVTSLKVGACSNKYGIYYLKLKL